MGYTYGLIQCPELRFDFEDLGQGGIRPLSMPWCVGLISVETITIPDLGAIRCFSV